MKEFFEHLGKILALCLGIAVFWSLFQDFMKYISDLDKSIAAALIAGTVTILVTFLSFLFTYAREQSKSRSEAHREKKVEIYSNFASIIFEMIKGAKDPEHGAEFTQSEAVMSKMWKLKEGILFYGSPEVIRAFNRWVKSQNSKTKVSPKAVMKEIGKVLLAMRKDLGLSNQGLSSLSIHQIYVTDDLSKLK